MQTEMKINYMILRDQIIVNFDSKTFTVNRGSDEFENILRIIKNSALAADNPQRTSLQELVPILDPQKAISDSVPDGLFVVQKGKIYSEGVQVSGYIGQKLIQFVEQGLPYMPLFNFWRKIKDNPSTNSRDQLYRFLESCLIPITEEGNFIAYKSVKKDMTDHHSGRFQYKLNQPATMPREQVVDSPDHACGAGLHVGSYKYATGMYQASTSILLEVEVNPADVVSVPKDHSSQKLRAWRILPVAICQGEYTSPVVVTKTEVRTPAPASVAPEVKAEMEENGSFLIGRDQYVSEVINESQFSEIHTSSKYTEVIALRPSKASTAVKKLSEQYGTLTNCVRFMDGTAKCYAAKYERVEEGAGIPVYTYIVFIPQGHAFVCETAVVTALNIDEYAKDIRVGINDYKARIVDTFELSEDVTNKRSLTRAKFPIALRELDSAENIKRCVRGVNTDGNSIFLVDIGLNKYIIYSAA